MYPQRELNNVQILQSKVKKNSDINASHFCISCSNACVHPWHRTVCPCALLCRLNCSVRQTESNARTLCFLERESRTRIMWFGLSYWIKTLISKVYPFSVFSSRNTSALIHSHMYPQPNPVT